MANTRATVCSTRSMLTSVALPPLVLALLAGCSANSGRVARFDPAPGTSVDERAVAVEMNGEAGDVPVSGKFKPTLQTGPGSARGTTSRTGPITPEWLASAETVGAGSPIPAPVLRKPGARNTQPFDRGSLTFSASTDADTPAGIEGGDGLTQITFASEGADFDPRIGRDGQTLVFASTQHRPTADLYVKKIGSRAVTQITSDPGNDVMPALSPDGNRVAFASDRNGTWQIFVMTAQGGRAVQLSPEGSCDLHPTWSPDGRRLAFCRLGFTSGRWEIWVTEASNPATAEFIGFGMFPVWSPVAGTGEEKSDVIAFQRGKERGDRAFGIWTVNYKPGFVSSPTQIVSSSEAGGAAINPNWSPDGRFITFATVKPGMGSGGGVWLAAADGSASVNLAGNGAGSASSPWWGRDGRVYFVSDRGGTETIWSVGTTRALAALSGPGSGGEAPVANVPEGGAGDTAVVPGN